jgi:hypothetical protein
MKNKGSLLIVILFFLLLSSCSNNAVYNVETNREAVKKIKLQEDSIGFQNDFSDKVAEFGQMAISCSQLFFHLFP